jgi:hypothetical protein
MEHCKFQWYVAANISNEQLPSVSSYEVTEVADGI